LLAFLFKAGSHAAGKQFGPGESSFRKKLLLAVVSALSVLSDLERNNGW